MKENKQLPKKMTPELWQLYRLIETATNEGRTLTVKQICEAFPDRYYLNAKECNYTNLLCDHLKNKYECDFAILNSGITEQNLAEWMYQ